MTLRIEQTMDDARREIALIETKLKSRLDEKGYGIFVSSHEMLGVIDEEMLELKMAVIANDRHAIEHELIDIAVACIWSLVSLRR
jgi:hypothetical protein